MTGKTILLAAGGTGGHLFPAEALAGVLAARGYRIALVTDGRAKGYGSAFAPEAIHEVPSATFAGRSPVAVLRTLAKIGGGVVRSIGLIRTLRPSVVVGFGGYPSIPPVLAAQILGVPSVVHEQNVVLGRANRLLARRAARVATGFSRLSKAPDGLERKMSFIGNPVRAAVREVAGMPYAVPTDGDIRLVVFGGSQGAKVMSDVVPAAVARLPEHLRARLRVTHQARAEDGEAAVDVYQGAGVAVEAAAFFSDLPARIAAAHLIVSRAGASTVAELAAIGRPAILVPLPGSLDQDQLANATAFAEAGGGTVLRQAEMTPERLSALLTERLDNPERLYSQAIAAKGFGVLDAADRLADLVEEIATASTKVTS